MVLAVSCLVWSVLAVLAYGVGFAHLQRNAHCFWCIQKNYYDDIWIAMICAALFSPAVLVYVWWCNRFEHGLKWQ